MSAWATWIVATGVEAGLAALVLLGLVAVLRVEAKWASLVLLLALLGFLLPPGWGLRLPTPGVAGEAGAGLATGRGWVGALVVGARLEQVAGPVQVEGERIGSGSAGPVARRILQAYHREVADERAREGPASS